MNSDGFDDIVTCGTADNHSSVDALLSTHYGYFATANASAVGDGPGAIAIGDFNSDGILDVVTANFGIEDGFNNTVSMLLGYGDGSFHNRRDFTVGGKPNSSGVVGVKSKYLTFLG